MTRINPTIMPTFVATAIEAARVIHAREAVAEGAWATPIVFGRGLVVTRTEAGAFFQVPVGFDDGCGPSGDVTIVRRGAGAWFVR